MKKYNKFSAVILAGVMAISLSACGENSSKVDGKTNELKMIFWDTNQEAGLKEMAEAFTAKNPDTKVKTETTPWGEYWTKLQAGATGGDMPDVVVMHPNEVRTYAEGGMIMDLSDIMEGDISNKDNFSDVVIKDFTVDGKIYGVPKDIGSVALYYNKDLFDNAGVAYPTDSWTWDDMYAAAEQVTNKEKDVYGIAAVYERQNYFGELVWQNGGDFFNADNTVCTYDSPEVVEALEYAVSFIKNGSSPTAADFANLTEVEYFQSGKLGMLTSGSWMLTQFSDMEGLNFDVAELPSKKEKATLVSGMAFSVSAKTKNPEAAKNLVEFLGSEEAQKIQAESGAAIPARDGTADAWVEKWTDVNVKPFVTASDYGHPSGKLGTNTEFLAVEDDLVAKIFELSIEPAEACKEIAVQINEKMK